MKIKILLRLIILHIIVGVSDRTLSWYERVLSESQQQSEKKKI